MVVNLPVARKPAGNQINNGHQDVYSAAESLETTPL